MPYKEREIEKLYYTIGEVAKKFNVNTSHIRFWSKHFDAIKPSTNKKGNRLYTAADIEIIGKIYELVKVKHYTLKGAQVELKNLRKKMRLEGKAETATLQIDEPTLFTEETSGETKPLNKAELKKSLEKMKATLLQLQKEIDSLKD
jgi:DNA-binding transcriptional MerR regulator